MLDFICWTNLGIITLESLASLNLVVGTSATFVFSDNVCAHLENSE